MAQPFLKSAATDAVTAFVKAKIDGESDSDAAAEAKKNLHGALLKAFEDAGAGKWKPLALPLSDLVEDGEGMVVQLVDPSMSSSSTTGGWKWDFKADASMKLVADVLDAAQLKLLGVVPRDGFHVVRYAVQGALQAGVSGGTKTGPWSFKAAASAAVNSGIEWYVAGRQHQYLGEALVKAIPFMAAPMNLADQLARAGDPEYWGCSTELAGTASASFSADASFAKTGWTTGFDGEKAKLVFSLGISGSARFKVQGKFRLRCVVRQAGQQPGGGTRYGVQVTLERLSTSEQAFAMSLKAGLDATALAQSAEKWLRANLPNPDPLLDKLTNPGTYISGKVQQALEKELAGSDFKDLVLLAAGYGNQQALAEKLAGQLTEPLVDEIDKLGEKVLGGIGSAGGLLDRWLDRAFGEVEVAGKAHQALSKLVDEHVDKAKDEVSQAIDDLAKSLKDKALDQAVKVLAPFGALGEKIQEHLKSAAAQLTENEAVTAIKDGLAEYAKLRNKVLGALGDAQRAKVTLALSASLEHSQKNQTFFRATFIAVNDMAGAERLFQALWSGRFEDIQALVDGARNAIYGEPEGWLLRADKLVRKQAIDINFLGFKLGQSLVKTSEVEFKVDLVGNILATGKASAEADTVNYWREREAKLAFTATRREFASGVVGAEVAFNGAYSAGGLEMSADLLEAMQRTLARVGGGGGSIDVRKLLGAPDTESLAGKNFFRDATFLLPVAVTADEFQVFLDADTAMLRATLVEYGMRAMDAEEDARWDDDPSRFLTRLSMGLTGSYASDLERVVRYLEQFPARWTSDPTRMDSSVYVRLGFEAGHMKRGSRLHSQLGELFRLAAMTRAIVELQARARSVCAVLVTAKPDSLAAAESAASAHLEALADVLAVFAVSSITLVGNDEMVAWPFAAFAAAMAKTVGREPPGFVGCAVLPGKDPVPLIPA